SSAPEVLDLEFRGVTGFFIRLRFLPSIALFGTHELLERGGYLIVVGYHLFQDGLHLLLGLRGEYATGFLFRGFNSLLILLLVLLVVAFAVVFTFGFHHVHVAFFVAVEFVAHRLREFINGLILFFIGIARFSFELVDGLIARLDVGQMLVGHF